jgi:hypothetical protein
MLNGEACTSYAANGKIVNNNIPISIIETNIGNTTIIGADDDADDALHLNVRQSNV